MHVLIAPDSFKGSCSAALVAKALAHGLRRALPAATAQLLPLSDGGEGFLETIASAVESVERRSTWVRGLTAESPEQLATWLWEPLAKRAFLEAAQTVGLIEAEGTAVLDRSSEALADLIKAARRAGAQKIIVGVGGTASVDGGRGVAQALGWPNTQAPDEELTCWCDVSTPLVSRSEGDLDVMAYAPQKGATPAECLSLRARLEDWVCTARNKCPEVDPTAPHTGAGGGIPFGLQLAAAAELRSGGLAISEIVELDRAIAEADWVWTGEGAFDRTSLEGKLVSVVASRAQRLGKRVHVFTGRSDLPASASPWPVTALIDRGDTAQECIERAESLLQQMAVAVAAALHTS